MGRTHNKSVSEGERRPARQPFRPPCWTQYIRDKDLLSHGLHSIPRKVLCQRDIQSRYTILHAICSSKLEIDVIRHQFGELDDLQLMGKVVARDGDGDMPLQSAVRSRANVDTVELILNYVPGSKAIMLQNKNRASETALELALFLDKRDLFELLLEECINMKLLPELTGIGKATRHSSTLVHKCVRHRRIDFLRAYLEVCQKCGVKPALSIPNEKGYTPWLYLLRYQAKDQPLVEEIFDVLKQYDVCLSSLYVEDRNRETMLHRAYRNGNQALIDLVLKYDPTALEKLDRHKRKPPQRSRKLVRAEPPTVSQAFVRQSKHKRRRHQPQPPSSAAPTVSSAAPTPTRGSKQQRQQEQRAPDSARNIPARDEVSAAIPLQHTRTPALKKDSSHHTSIPRKVTTTRARRRDSDELLPVDSGEKRFVGSCIAEVQPHSPNPQWVPGTLRPPEQPP